MNRIASIPEESIREVSKLENKIKAATGQDVVCIVYEKA